MNSSLAFALSLIYLSPAKASRQVTCIICWVQDLDLVSALKINSEFVCLSFSHYAFIRRLLFQLVFEYFEIVIALVDFVEEGRGACFCFQNAANFT